MRQDLSHEQLSCTPKKLNDRLPSNVNHRERCIEKLNGFKVHTNDKRAALKQKLLSGNKKAARKFTEVTGHRQLEGFTTSMDKQPAHQLEFGVIKSNF